MLLMLLSRQIDMSILIIITNPMFALRNTCVLHTNYPGKLSAAVSNQHRINQCSGNLTVFEEKFHNVVVPYVNTI